MSYTEIPTDLLWRASNLLGPLGYRFDQADCQGNIKLKITEEEMFRLMPLIRWLDYHESTTWGLETDRD